MVEEIVRDITCFLQGLKRKKNNINFKVFVKGDKLYIFIRLFDGVDYYDFNYESALDLTIENRIQLKDDIINQIVYF